jgi:UDP-N-acetylmuramoyl-tripeptide--D-alanyl-D-alanine ligase
MFKINEIIEATGGRLLRCNKDDSIRKVSIDSREVKKGDLFIAIKGNNFNGHDFIAEALKNGASCIMMERSSPKKHSEKTKAAIIEVNDTVRALGDIASFRRKKNNPIIIAVTGSNGKTTAKDMIAWVLSDKYKVLKNEGTRNNHIGLPMALLNLEPKDDCAVLELGTNHPGEIGYLAGIAQPNIGLITNIGPSHLEYLKDLSGVLKEKSSLLRYLQKPGIVILNYDDNLLRMMAKNFKKKAVFGFAIKAKGDFSARLIKGISTRVNFRVNNKCDLSLKSIGYFNVYNALAALSLGRIMGLDYKDIARRLSGFNFPQGRLNLLELGRARFIDDTYNSNPLSLRAALEALACLRVKGRKILVMGDMLELGASSRFYHRRLGREVSKVCDVFISVGELSKAASSAAKASRMRARDIFHCQDIPRAKDILFNRLSLNSDDIVLVKGSRSMKMEEVFKK